MEHKNKILFTIVMIVLNVLLFFCVSRWWLFATIPITLLYFMLREECERFYNIFFGIAVANLAVILLPFSFWVWLCVFVVGVIAAILLFSSGYEDDEFKKQYAEMKNHFSGTQSDQSYTSTQSMQPSSQMAHQQFKSKQPVQSTYSKRPAHTNGMYRNNTYSYPNNVQVSATNSNNNEFFEKMKNKGFEKLEDKLQEKCDEFVDKMFDDDKEEDYNNGNSYQGNYRRNKQSTAYNQQQDYHNQEYGNQNYRNQGYSSQNNGYQRTYNADNDHYYTPPSSNSSYSGGYDGGGYDVGGYDDYDD